MCTAPQQNRSGQIYSCGKCSACHNKYIRQWVFRLQRQQHSTPNCVFLTLTYSYEHMPMYKGKMTLHKKDYQDFLKRLRKQLHDREIKYVLCGEYGSKTNRPHYHAIMFNVTQEDYNTIHTAWGKGHVHVGTVTPASIAYTFKYSIKGDIKERDWRCTKQFVSMSQGLGEDFAFTITHKKSTGIDKNGKNFVRYTKIRTPKAHFKDKLDKLLQMPYYTIPSSNGGTVKMSIPKFYLRAADYDTAQLGELFKDVIQNKYHRLPQAKKDAMFAKQAIQQKYAVIQQTKDREYSVTKEIM